MKKQVIYKTLLILGDKTITKIESYYDIRNAKIASKEEFVFIKNKKIQSYGDDTIEELLIDNETIKEINTVYEAIRSVIISLIPIPEESSFKLNSLEIEKYKINKKLDNKIIANYSLIYEDMHKNQSIDLSKELSEEIKKAIKNLFELNRIKVSDVERLV